MTLTVCTRFFRRRLGSREAVFYVVIYDCAYTGFSTMSTFPAYVSTPSSNSAKPSDDIDKSPKRSIGTAKKFG